MSFILIADILLIVALIYLFSIREYLVARKKFGCLRCGDCCRLRVKLNNEDKKKLIKAGYLDFEDKEGFLRRINGHCIFLGMKNGVGKCEIEKIKPQICETFPSKKGIFGEKRDYRCRSCWQKKIYKK